MKKNIAGYILLWIILALPFVLGYIFWLRGKNQEFQTNTLNNITASLRIWPSGYNRYSDQLFATKKKLYMQTYHITYDEFVSDIQTLAKQWVDIQIMLENNRYADNNSNDEFEKLKNDLSKYWIQIKSDQELGTNFIHSKYVLGDDEYIIQTANMTYSAFWVSREMFVIGHNPSIYNSLTTLFRKDREDQSIQKQDIHPNLAVCPIDCRTKIEWLLHSAKQSIYIQTQNIDDQRIINILKQKKQEGIDIQIILWRDDDEIFRSQYGHDWVKILDKPYVHAKSFLIDNEYLFVWSTNLTQNSIDNNREVSIILLDEQNIEKYLQNFQADLSR